ncbi:hypothetical protein GJ744_002090 [Endocarpon pusillum]|uniref:Uncharacterized protein n=1 Tax=Endocarpon pusillum TaxID=364733 RepID=A0A8H7E0Q9_9EURO|nr:hypothetical protein GJ744_002090 [Endocarpon pusillum]
MLAFIPAVTSTCAGMGIAGGRQNVPAPVWLNWATRRVVVVVVNSVLAFEAGAEAEVDRGAGPWVFWARGTREPPDRG